MTNFEKFKQDLTVEKLAILFKDSWVESCCNYCAYNSQTCPVDCEYGIKKFLESEAEYYE